MFLFFNIKLVENLTLYFFLKHCGLLQSFPTCFFFCYEFFQNCLCQFYFFNIELIENYNCIFPHKTLYIATVFPYMFFFLLFFYVFFLKLFL
jgi:hypothetical protein